MRSWRTALLAGLLLTVTACSGPAPTFAQDPVSPAPSAGAASGARAELVKAVRRTQASTLKFATTGQLPDDGRVKATGSFDPAGRRSSRDVTGTGAIRIILVGQDAYQHSNAGWIHLDLRRVKKDSAFFHYDPADPVGLTAFGTLVSDVERTGKRSYAGLLKPSPGQSAPFLPLGAPSIVSLGDVLTKFEATTDAKGYLETVEVQLQTPGKAALTMRTAFSGHGKPVTVRAPGTFLEADAVYYK
jgi:hypothetical protein